METLKEKYLICAYCVLCYVIYQEEYRPAQALTEINSKVNNNNTIRILSNIHIHFYEITDILYLFIIWLHLR